MKNTLLAIALIGTVFAAPFFVSLVAVTFDRGGAVSSDYRGQPASGYYGPENFWSE
jgi:hypothetical protein